MTKTLQDFEDIYPIRNLDPSAEVVRLAPSPTGLPHIGTAMQAIINKALSLKNDDGVFILRIEDTDKSRIINGATESIINDLKWLRILPNEGPYYQSKRLELYRIAAQYLISKGKAYHCFCTTNRLNLLRQQQKKSKLITKYDGLCRNLSKEEIHRKHNAGEKSVIRMLLPNNTEEIIFHDLVRGNIKFNSNVLNDSILLKSDGWPTYHLASVVDDHFMRITTVVRGEEWISSTPQHIILYQAFNWQIPKFLHTVLLRDKDKRKLSKRCNDTKISWYRERGYLPQGFINFLTRVIWAHPENKDIYNINEFARMFKAKSLPTTGPIVDIKLLNFINNKYIAKFTSQELMNHFLVYLQDFNLYPNLKNEITANIKYSEKVMSLEPERHNTLYDVIINCGFFFDSMYHLPTKKDFNKIYSNYSVIVNILTIIKDIHINSADKLLSTVKEIVLKYNINNKKIVFMIIRLALTGLYKTPPLYSVIEVLGKFRYKSRLTKILSNITLE